MIAVIDYKAGNLTSVVKALGYLGAREVVMTQSPEVVLAAEKVVLPGVGHFQATQLLGGAGADGGGTGEHFEGGLVSGDLCGVAVVV
jgi:hypothetical protein